MGLNRTITATKEGVLGELEQVRVQRLESAEGPNVTVRRQAALKGEAEGLRYAAALIRDWDVKLTLDTAQAIADVMQAAQESAKVYRTVGNRSEGTPVDQLYGTARAIVNPDDENFASGRSGYDFRECRLWVTLTSGFEAFWPIGELLGEITKGTAGAQF